MLQGRVKHLLDLLAPPSGHVADGEQRMNVDQALDWRRQRDGGRWWRGGAWDCKEGAGGLFQNHLGDVDMVHDHTVVVTRRRMDSLADRRIHSNVSID